MTATDYISQRLNLSLASAYRSHESRIRYYGHLCLLQLVNENMSFNYEL